MGHEIVRGSIQINIPGFEPRCPNLQKVDTIFRGKGTVTAYECNKMPMIRCAGLLKNCPKLKPV